VAPVRRRISLAGQLLALQIVIVCAVLVCVAAVSLAQSNARFRDTEGRTALAVAEAVADTTSVRLAFDSADRRRFIAQARTVAESARTVSGSSYVIIGGADRVVIASPDPADLGRPLDLHGSPVLTGRGWVGTVRDDYRALAAHVPVLSENTRDVIGFVAVGRRYPTQLESLATAAPNLLVYLGIATVLGVAGSLLAARWVKRQTFGLEPREIAGLVEHRDAMLHGIKEGVLALDLHQRVTLVNDEAAQLLDLPPDPVGRSLPELAVDRRLYEALSGQASETDQVVPVGARVLILNRMPIHSRGRLIGSVTTLRDRTELLTLQRELDVTRHTTETLRAQTHEFSNRLHTVSGLIELGEYGEVVRYVQRVSADHKQVTDAVTTRIADPAVAALLIAKASLAAEQGVELRVAPTSRLGRPDEALSADIATVVGNLVDNALDAVPAGAANWVDVEVLEAGEEVRITVRDSGPGIAEDVRDEVFRQGFTTKATRAGQPRGVGLALIRLVCQRRGGDVTVRNEGGAVFVARLPVPSTPRSGGPSKVQSKVPSKVPSKVQPKVPS
jgi:two-component system CitB family sensor kinase